MVVAFTCKITHLSIYVVFKPLYLILFSVFKIFNVLVLIHTEYMYRRDSLGILMYLKLMWIPLYLMRSKDQWKEAVCY